MGEFKNSVGRRAVPTDFRHGSILKPQGLHLYMTVGYLRVSDPPFPTGQRGQGVTRLWPCPDLRLLGSWRLNRNANIFLEILAVLMCTI